MDKLVVYITRESSEGNGKVMFTIEFRNGYRVCLKPEDGRTELQEGSGIYAQIFTDFDLYALEIDLCGHVYSTDLVSTGAYYMPLVESDGLVVNF